MMASNGEVNAAFNNFAAGNKTTAATMSTELNKLGVGADHFKEFIRAQISWNRVLSAKLRSETVQKSQGEAIFELRRAGEEKPETTEYQLQQIIFVIPEEKRKDLMKVRKSEALNFMQRFSGCDASFELAKTLTDVTVKSLGRVMQPELPQEWKDDVSATEVGKTTNPKETDKGVELIAVCSSKLTSDDRAAQIVNQAQTFEELGKQGSKAGDSFLSEIRKQATIVYR
jgi:peptidyl-prolyl cis-trans isomerase SurA